MSHGFRSILMLQRSTPRRLPSRPMPRAVAACVLSAVLPAVLHAQASISATEGAGVRTWAADSFWVRDWFRGANKDPELFTEPRHVVVVGDLVVVLDEGLREVSAFEARTGKQRLSLTAKGEGP